MNKKKPKIALAPIRYFDVSKKNNLEKIKNYIKKAKKANADIVCFPESCIHKTEQLAYNDDLIKEIRKECKKNKIWCIITEDLILNGKSYNASILIDRNGEIKGKYKKIHLYGDDVSPGRKIRVFKTDFAKIGIVICWDLAFPELFKKMKEAGAEIVFCPSQWRYEKKAYKEYKKETSKQKETEILRSLVNARAFENLCFVAICNPSMDLDDLISYTAVVSPRNVLKETINQQKLLTVEINLDEIRQLENLYPMNVNQLLHN